MTVQVIDVYSEDEIQRMIKSADRSSAIGIFVFFSESQNLRFHFKLFVSSFFDITVDKEDELYAAEHFTSVATGVTV